MARAREHHSPGDPPVALWLAVIYGLILVMVAVGGITRLTESGLSMVDWRPITGFLPPLSEAEWQAEFARYKGSPQFQKVNSWMALADFQRIFFWEYFHRLLGRFLGLAVALPWLVFALRGRLRGCWLRHTAFIPLLIGAQGAMGWFMVKSGLVDQPAVSHFRLAAHLLLAFGSAQWVLWLLLRWRAERRPATPPRPLPRGWWPLLATTLALVVVQIAFGAFVAGTRAGLLFPSFPDMNGLYAPGHFFTSWGDAFTSPVAIHWTHRALAFGLLGPLGALVWRSLDTSPVLRRAALATAGLVAMQIVLGAATVLWHVPISVAVIHQCVALLLLSALVVMAFEARPHR